MRKKLLLLLSSFLLVGLLIFSCCWQEGKNQILNPISSKRAHKLMERLEESQTLDFSCLLCNESRVPYDSAGKTFYVPVNMETDQWESFFFLSGQPEYEILFLEDFTKRDKQELLKAGGAVDLLVYSGTEYAMYSIVFTGLPLINIATEQGLGESFTGTIGFFDTDFASKGKMESQVEAHVRGNTSRMYPKQGYKLHLKKTLEDGSTVKDKKSIFGMRKDDDWILYAIYNDESKIRDRLSIDLWQEMGAGKVEEDAVYNTSLTYAEVIIDDCYYGLYGLMEPIDKKQLNLSGEDYLYKRKQPYGLAEDGFEDCQDPETSVLGFEIKSGIKDDNAWKPMEGFCDFLWMSQEDFNSQASRYINIDNAARMWLFLQMITGHDQRAKNMYYVAKKTKEGYEMSFAPWDMDLTWGNVSVGEENPLYTDFEYETVDDFISWETADRLIALNTEGAADLVVQVYEELRAGSYSDENLRSKILAYDHLLRDSGAMERDAVRWPESAQSEDCSRLVSYAVDRMHYLDEQMQDLQAYMKDSYAGG